MRGHGISNILMASILKKEIDPMSTQPSPNPQRIMQLISGGWSAAILGAAAKHGIFNALENNGGDAKSVAAQYGISERDAQSELDGLTGLGLLTLSNAERICATNFAGVALRSVVFPAVAGSKRVSNRRTRWRAMPLLAASVRSM